MYYSLFINWTNVNRENRRKSHRVCRRDREPSRISIRSLKRLRNKSRKVKKFDYACILSCIPLSSTLYCYVSAKKLLNKRIFKFNCRERIRQSIRKVKYRASRYLTLFSCNKLMFSCKSEAYVANYCCSNYKLSRDIEKNPGPPTYVDLNKTVMLFCNECVPLFTIAHKGSALQMILFK